MIGERLGSGILKQKNKENISWRKYYSFYIALLTTTVINRREIEDIAAVGNKFLGVINCMLIFNLPTGIKMLQGKKRVLLKKKYQEDRIVFWLFPDEVSKLRSNI